METCPSTIHTQSQQSKCSATVRYERERGGEGALALWMKMHEAQQPHVLDTSTFSNPDILNVLHYRRHIVTYQHSFSI